MDGNRFDNLIRAAASRRRLLSGALGMAATGLGLPNVDAKAKRKQKARFNAFGCVNVDGFCKNASQCCSGICEGKKGKRKCRAHDGGSGCQAGQIEDGCADGVEDVECTTSTGQVGICNTTTGNAGYCIKEAVCVSCKKDVDCRLICGADAAACIRCNGCAGGTACVGPSTGDCAPK